MHNSRPSCPAHTLASASPSAGHADANCGQSISFLFAVDGNAAMPNEAVESAPPWGIFMLEFGPWITSLEALLDDQVEMRVRQRAS